MANEMIEDTVEASEEPAEGDADQAASITEPDQPAVDAELKAAGAAETEPVLNRRLISAFGEVVGRHGLGQAIGYLGSRRDRRYHPLARKFAERLGQRLKAAGLLIDASASVTDASAPVTDAAAPVAAASSAAGEPKAAGDSAAQAGGRPADCAALLAWITSVDGLALLTATAEASAVLDEIYSETQAVSAPEHTV